jgi:rare lipoprotein A
MKRRIAFSLLLAVLLAGCAKKKRVPVAPAAPRPASVLRVGDEETGIASWYGHPYHGRRASNGEIYDMEKLTAAHRTLPFETTVLVRNLDNGRTVEVRITDRGPFVDGRIIDLSRAAARDIAMLGPGTAKVRVRVVKLPPVVPEAYFAVQIGAFRQRANAERERGRMQERYGSARMARRDGNPALWRVLVGRAGTEQEAAALAERIRAGGGTAFVVRVEAGEADL